MTKVTMKKTFVYAGVALLCTAAPALAQTGNGAPSGSHYNLNILGKDHCAGDDLTGSNRHTIEVLLNFDDGNNTGQLLSELDRRNKIFLTEGDFQVLDGNACDGDGAQFQLPANPFTCPVDDPNCLDTDPTFQGYSVYVRALGKPGGSATMTTCAAGAGDDGVLGNTDDEIVCSTENVVLVRSTGRSKFTNKTKELTTIVADIDGDGLVERIGLFDDALHTYFWDYDNRGLRLAQLRFYPIAD
jgi:hypothetical protein